MNLSDYQSPADESSCFKGIPIVYRYHPKIRKIMKSRLFSVRYRGKSKPGYVRPQQHCHKEGADTFAIYPYSSYPEYSELRKSIAAKIGYHDHNTYITNLNFEMNKQLGKVL